MRGLLLTSLLLVAGCDSVDGLRPIPDVMIVELAENGLLQLETESYNYCGGSIYVDSHMRPGEVVADVKGADLSAGICDGLHAGQWRVMLTDIPVEVRIRHTGETDLYRVQSGDNDLQLDALKISTTRPGPR